MYPVEECSVLPCAIDRVSGADPTFPAHCQLTPLAVFLTVLLAFSTCPLPSGYDVIRDFFISSIWHSALNSRDLKLRPQSVSMVSGGIISANPLSCLLMPLRKSWLADWARCTMFIYPENLPIVRAVHLQRSEVRTGTKDCHINGEW